MGITRRTANITVAIATLMMFLSVPLAQAQSSISQGFNTNEALAPGTIVSQKKGEETVERATLNDSSSLIGVASSQSLVELSSGAKQAQVVTSGTTKALVSDINGEIRAGDKITISPLEGIGMKAMQSGYVIGTAVADFSEADDVTSKQVTDKSGKENTIQIGSIPIQVNVSYFEDIDVNKSILPEFVLTLARSITGKEVSVLRILIALVVLVVGIISIGVLLYSSVRSSIISIGRNPLAASAVNKSLLQVAFLSLGVLLIMLSAVYLILIV